LGLIRVSQNGNFDRFPPFIRDSRLGLSKGWLWMMAPIAAIDLAIASQCQPKHFYRAFAAASIVVIERAVPAVFVATKDLRRVQF
jgi:hypothetical protein